MIQCDFSICARLNEFERIDVELLQPVTHPLGRWRRRDDDELDAGLEVPSNE